jgi:S1-C subfamily serine protease
MRPTRLAPLLLGLLAAAPLAAQEPEVRVFSTTAQRARLGVSVDVRADKELDAVGARIRDVVPDGPADKAGLKPGDIVTRLDGQSLAGVRSDDEEASGPGRRLVELAQKLEPGDTVKVEYRRDGRARTATVVAEEVEFAGMMRTPELARLRERLPEMARLPERMPMLEALPGEGFAWAGMAPAGLRLAELNPGLGEYFGTSEGLLVLEPPADSTLPLRAGDVIRAIDGRKPQSAQHAVRILRSYAKGEQVKLDITRQRRQSTVTWTVPEEATMRFRRAEPSRMRVAPRAPLPPRAPRAAERS